jgi:integrase
MFKRSGIWWTCITHNGRKIQKSLETSDKKLAKTIEAKIITELVQGSYYEKPVGSKKTFKQLMSKFMVEHAPKVSSSMQRGYCSYSKHLIKFFGETNLLSVTTKKISRYKVIRNEAGAKPATINRELAMLSKAFNLAVKEWEWLNENPVSKVPKEKEDNKRDRWLTQEEENRLLGFSPEWLSEIIVFALNTGLRQDELLSLEWPRVSLIRKTILIQKSKSGRPRTVPLNRFGLELLNMKYSKKVLSINGLVFVSSVGTKIDADNLRRAFYGVLKKAEIENFKFHDLRHTFATRLAQSGIDIYKIAKLLGHEDIRMTQRYAHHCPESLRDGVEILESYYNPTTILLQCKKKSL